MKTDEVICPNCGKPMHDYHRADRSFCCNQPVYPWQSIVHDLSGKAFWLIMLGYVLLELIGASLLQGRLYIPLLNGLTTDAVGIGTPLFLFYFTVVIIRRIDMGLRFVWPGQPRQWKLNLISVVNMLLYLGLILMAIKFCQARGLLWMGAAGDTVSTAVRYQSGRAVINAGHGAYLLGLSGFVVLMLTGWAAEVLKVLRRIYPSPGFPDIL